SFSFLPALRSPRPAAGWLSRRVASTRAASFSPSCSGASSGRTPQRHEYVRCKHREQTHTIRLRLVAQQEQHPAEKSGCFSYRPDSKNFRISRGTVGHLPDPSAHYESVDDGDD